MVVFSHAPACALTIQSDRHDDDLLRSSVVQSPNFDKTFSHGMDSDRSTESDVTCLVKPTLLDVDVGLPALKLADCDDKNLAGTRLVACVLLDQSTHSKFCGKDPLISIITQDISFCIPAWRPSGVPSVWGRIEGSFCCGIGWRSHKSTHPPIPTSEH